MILIGISGKRGTGKDTLANILSLEHNFLKMSFAAELKRQVREEFKLTDEHIEGSLKAAKLPNGFTPREIMIRYGNFFRQFDTNWWIGRLFDKIASLGEFVSQTNPQHQLNVAISDVRFKNEADYIKQQGGVLVRLERKDNLNIYPTKSNDASECDLDNYAFDMTLNEEQNLNFESLRLFANTIVWMLEKKV